MVYKIFMRLLCPLMEGLKHMDAAIMEIPQQRGWCVNYCKHGFLHMLIELLAPKLCGLLHGNIVFSQ